MARIWAPWCWGVALILLLVGVFWGLFIAPADYQQKDAYRIIFIHVPVSAMSMGVYVSMAVASVIYFVWHIKLAAYFCRSLAVLGTVFTALALFTGAVWGKPMWGTYWSWGDARLLSELILLFLYLGYIGLISAIEQERLADKIGSILLLVGVINIPVIHYSVVWWNSLHQGATVLKLGKPAISTEMLIPLLVCLAAFVFFSAGYALTSVRAKIIEAKNEKILLSQLHS
ncbi:MAG: heme ABC transporter permease [Gammaproteobacteria bacterium]|nr:MAG: heme ABC transporter permease [Gammaproteobacteria bacterium]